MRPIGPRICPNATFLYFLSRLCLSGFLFLNENILDSFYPQSTAIRFAPPEVCCVAHLPLPSFSLPCLSRSRKSILAAHIFFLVRPDCRRVEYANQRAALFLYHSHYYRGLIQTFLGSIVSRNELLQNGLLIVISLNVLTMLDICSACYCFSPNARDISSFRVL